MKKLQTALFHLQNLIAGGWEYPEAEWSAICKFALTDSQVECLRREYDQSFED